MTRDSGEVPGPDDSRDDPATEARAAVAETVRNLGHALVEHRPGPELLARVRERIAALLPEIEAAPARTTADLEARHARFFAAIDDAMRATSAAEDGALDLLPESIVSGRLNPLGVGLRIAREGEEVVGRVQLGPAHEGPPGRAHGGIVSAMVDEAMTYVLGVVGAFGYTGRLSITFLAPTPVGEELELRARLRERDGRKLIIECTGTHGTTRFVEAEGLFVAVDASAVTSPEVAP